MNYSELADIVFDSLKGAVSGADKRNTVVRPSFKTGFFLREKYINSASSLSSGNKRLITEYEIRKEYAAQGRRIKLSGPHMLSPLARDFILEKDIEIVCNEK